jgi:hypothetical protein
MAQYQIAPGVSKETVWVVIDRSGSVVKPYSRVYHAFDTFQGMEEYVVKAGFVGEPATLMRDPGMVNFFKQGGVDLEIMQLFVK